MSSPLSLEIEPREAFGPYHFDAERNYRANMAVEFYDAQVRRSDRGGLFSHERRIALDAAIWALWIADQSLSDIQSVTLDG